MDKLEGMEEYGSRLSSRHDKAVMPMSSLQLCLPAQYWACQQPLMVGRQVHEALPLPDKLLVVNNCCETGSCFFFFFFRSVATAKWPEFQNNLPPMLRQMT